MKFKPCGNRWEECVIKMTTPHLMVSRKILLKGRIMRSALGSQDYNEWQQLESLTLQWNGSKIHCKVTADADSFRRDFHNSNWPYPGEGWYTRRGHNEIHFVFVGATRAFFFAFFLLGSSFLFLGCSLVKWKCHSSRIMQYKLLQLERSYSTDEGALWVENWELRTGNPLTIDKRQPTKEDILTCVCLKASGKTWNHKRAGWLTGWLDGWPKESFMSIIPVKWAANQSFCNFLSAFQIQKITIWNPIRWA